MAAVGFKSVSTLLVCGLLLGGCGGLNPFDGVTNTSPENVERNREAAQRALEENGFIRSNRESIFNLFDLRDDPNTTVEVNKYIWNAALDVLDFMPIEAVDPFSGIIVTGFGTAPGSRTAYRATVLIRDPALDARSLYLALNTRRGPASPDTVRAIEDAILTRARQLRIADGRL